MWRKKPDRQLIFMGFVLRVNLCFIIIDYFLIKILFKKIPGFRTIFPDISRISRIKNNSLIFPGFPGFPGVVDTLCMLKRLRKYLEKKVMILSPEKTKMIVFEKGKGKKKSRNSMWSDKIL